MSDTNKNSEEIDLGQLFILIGAAFKKITSNITRLFRFIFNKIISFFIFIQTHFLKFIIAGVIGFVVGLIIDINNPEIYRSTMTVEPNLGSTRQLYGNIEMYDELVKAGDSIELSKIFKLNPEEAASLAEFSVKALVSKNRMLSSYNKYISTLDSTSRNIIDFEDYIKDFDPIDAATHSIVVDATNDRIVKKLETTIISYINSNPYYKLKKETTDLNIEGSKRILQEQLKDIDTLKKIYREVIINQSKPVPAAGGTSISFSEKEVKTKEFELLQETREISREVERLNIEKIENKNIINIISNFPERGVRYSSLLQSKKVLFPVIFVLLTFMILVLLAFNKYLKGFNSKN